MEEPTPIELNVPGISVSITPSAEGAKGNFTMSLKVDLPTANEHVPAGLGNTVYNNTQASLFGFIGSCAFTSQVEKEQLRNLLQEAATLIDGKADERRFLFVRKFALNAKPDLPKGW